MDEGGSLSWSSCRAPTPGAPKNAHITSVVWSGEAWVGETSSQSLIEGALGHVPWALIKLEFQFLADINILLMIRSTSMKLHNISNYYKFTATYSSEAKFLT